MGPRVNNNDDGADDNSSNKHSEPERSLFILHTNAYTDKETESQRG